MLRFGRRTTTIGITHWRHNSIRCVSTQLPTQQRHDPLNILFCGSDAFSIYSLRALHALQTTQPHKINSIEVVCRPDKRVGRNLKTLRQVPIKPTAQELSLPLHQLDTFKAWSPSPRTNLVVAVSFGLLVPARILGAAKYGGLNVHPSLLPDLRGPAPIPRALLGRRERTGVTLQTMHPTQFDRGFVLNRTAGVGVEGETVGSLVDSLGKRGAELLCDGIEKGLFLGPSDGGEVREDVGDYEYASKITAEDRRVEWKTWDSDEILLRDRVLGRLWDVEIYAKCCPGSPSKRVTYHGPWTAVQHSNSTAEGGDPVLIDSPSGDSVLLGITTSDGMLAIPASLTIEGEAKGGGMPSLVAAMQRRKTSI